MNTQIIGVRELRQNLAQITNKMTKENINYFVFKNNKPVFELKPISKKEVERLVFLSSIKNAHEDIKHGRVHSILEIEKEFGL